MFTPWTIKHNQTIEQDIDKVMPVATRLTKNPLTDSKCRPDVSVQPFFKIFKGLKTWPLFPFSQQLHGAIPQLWIFPREMPSGIWRNMRKTGMLLSWIICTSIWQIFPTVTAEFAGKKLWCHLAASANHRSGWLPNSRDQDLCRPHVQKKHPKAIH